MLGQTKDERKGIFKTIFQTYCLAPVWRLGGGSAVEIGIIMTMGILLQLCLV